MSLFAISDIHLSLGTDKPMDVFCGNWEGYSQKLKDNWLKTVAVEDTVIIPGDVSWATYIQNTFEDFSFLNNLPGRKIISKGNHDYWWGTVSKMNKFLVEKGFNNIFFLHNNYFQHEEWAICGAKGWSNYETLPGCDNRKMLEREKNRLEFSLKSAKDAGQNNLIAVLHFPPFSFGEGGFIEIMKRYNVKICLYGHLHGDFSMARQGVIDGIDFRFVSADYLNFKPERIL